MDARVLAIEKLLLLNLGHRVALRMSIPEKTASVGILVVRQLISKASKRVKRFRSPGE